MMTARAGGTARGGILGRRKRVLPEPPSYVTMWQGGRLVRCLLSEARKYGSAATLPERRNDPLQVQHFRGSPGRSGGTDPRGKRLP